MKKFLTAHEPFLAGTVKILLILLVLVRLGIAWPGEPPVDTQYFVETARLVLQGRSPYRGDTNTTIYKYPLQAPSMSLLAMPFCFVPEKASRVFFFACGILTFLGFTLLVFRYYGHAPRDIIRSRWRNLPIWTALAMICCSSPFALMLRHGQNSGAAALLLFAALFYPARDGGTNILLLGLSAAMKYSMLTMQIPVLLVQKRWRLGVTAFGLFAVLVLSVGLWLDGIFPAIRDYILLVIRDINRGANSYSNMSSFQFVHLGFFQCQWVNRILKALLLTLYAAALVKIARRSREHGRSAAAEGLTAAEWGAFTAMTMVISYHRAYDGVIFMPFLGVVFVERCRSVCGSGSINFRQTPALLAVAAILLFWTLPMGRVFVWESRIADLFPGGAAVFKYARGGGGSMFPVYQIMMLLSTLALFIPALAHRSGGPACNVEKDADGR